MVRWRFNAALACLVLLSTTIARADVVTDWNAVMLTTIGSQNPFAQARAAAMMQIAVFEAVNAITKRYTPYLGTIDAPRGASPEAAAVAAAYRVLATLFPSNLAALDSARAASLGSIADGSARTDGIAVGEAAAAAILAARASDGSTPPAFYVPPALSAGEWQLTPSCTAGGGAFFHWSHVTPFVITSADQFRSDPPPALNRHKYARDFNEVNAVGGMGSTERPDDRAAVARFYAAVSASVVWNQAASQILTARNASLSRSARAFALLNLAIFDASIATFDTKYHYNFWRPETAIPAADLDNNPRTDPVSFVPFITTPCFPSYPSAHAALSNAGRAILDSLFGRRRHPVTLSSAALGLTLHYTRLREITDDIDDARVYGGIHFRFDQEAGGEQGREVGQYIHRHALRPVHVDWREKGDHD
jgi:hypothetical protein